MGPVEGGISMEITSKHLHTLGELAIVMRVYVTPIMEQAGQIIRAAAVDAIRLQQPPGTGTTWAGLTKDHLKWKQKKGYSSNIYTMTGTYMSNIVSHYDPVTMTLEVGVMRGIMHQGEKRAVELCEVASVLEYGYAALKIPARPLWRPLLLEHEHSIKTRIGIALGQAMRHVARHAPAAPGGPS